MSIFNSKVITSVSLYGKTITKGMFVYSSYHGANVEVLNLCDYGLSRGEKALHRFTISTAGLEDSIHGKSFSPFDPEAETIFHETEDKGISYFEVERELLDKEEYKEFIEYNY